MPDFALGARPAYRVEVGLATFAGFHLRSQGEQVAEAMAIANDLERSMQRSLRDLGKRIDRVEYKRLRCSSAD